MEDKVGEVRIDKIMGPAFLYARLIRREDILWIINEGKNYIETGFGKPNSFDDQDYRHFQYL